MAFSRWLLRKRPGTTKTKDAKKPKVNRREAARQAIAQTNRILRPRIILRSDMSLSKGKPENGDFVLLSNRFVTHGTFLGQVVSGKIVLTHKMKNVREPGKMDQKVFLKKRKPRVVEQSSFNELVDRIVKFKRVSTALN